jgi:hypothetical protein
MVFQRTATVNFGAPLWDVSTDIGHFKPVVNRLIFNAFAKYKRKTL